MIHPARMRANVDASHGLYFSQRLLLALVDAGLARDAAYRLVQRHAMQAWEEELELVTSCTVTPRSPTASTSPRSSISAPTQPMSTTVFERLRALVAERGLAVHA